MYRTSYNTRWSVNLFSAALVAVFALSISAGLTQAASVTWTGATSGTWLDGDSTNWDATFNNGDDVTFNDTGSNPAITTSGTISQIGMLFNNSSVDYSFAGSIGGTGGITKNGTGLVTLSGANTFTGTTIINNGIVSINADSRLGAAPGSPVANQIELDGGTLRNTQGFTLNANRGMFVDTSGGTIDSTGTLTYNGAISGTGDLVVDTNGGTVRLGGNSTHAGLLTVQGGGIVEVDSLNALGTAAGGDGVIVQDGSIIKFDSGGNFTWADDFSLNGELRNDISSNNNLSGDVTLTTDTSIISNYSTSGGSFGILGDVTGNFDLEINSGGNYREVRFSTIPKTYTGSTLVDGRLNVQSTSGISTGDLTFNNSLVGGTARAARIDLDNAAQTIGTFSGTLTDAGGGHTLTLDLGNSHDLTIVQSADGTFEGVISGATGTITLDTTSTAALKLTGDNTYGGGTTIDGGTLFASNSTGSATGTGAVVVNNGGTLGGTGSVAGLVTVNSGGTLEAGESTGTLTLDGGLLLLSGSMLKVEIEGTTAGAGGYDQIIVNGTATLGGLLSVEMLDGFVPALTDSFVVLTADTLLGTFDNPVSAQGFIDVGGFMALISYDGNQVTLTSLQVPEPSSATLLGLSGLAVLMVRRRARRRVKTGGEKIARTR